MIMYWPYVPVNIVYVLHVHDDIKHMVVYQPFVPISIVYVLYVHEPL